MNRKTSSKRKKYRKSSDFYTQKELFEEKIPFNPVTINDFNSRGEIINPKAPCVATNIDPEYFKDATIRLPVRKFLVKTDTMKIRNVMRTKFFMYTNQQRAIEKAKEYEKHKQIYESVMDFYKFCSRRLNSAKLKAFGAMKEAFNVLEELNDNTLEEDLKELLLQHQRVYIEVLEDYFDNFTKEGENILKLNEPMKTEYSDFLETLPNAHTHENIEKFQKLIEELVLPYLNKQNYLDVQIWKTGYENIRRKMFNYSRHLSRVALLSHIVSIVSYKFEKTQSHMKKVKIFRKDPTIIHTQTQYIQNVALKSLETWEDNQHMNKNMIEVNGIVPVLLRKLKIDGDPEDPTVDRKSSVLEKIGEIHEIVIDVLHRFDNVEPDKLRKLELQVRGEIEKSKAESHKALIKEIRLKNLLKHYKDHFKKKNIVSGYITNLPRPKGKIYPLKNKSK